MSLFGTSPEAPSRPKYSLFDDDNNTTSNGNGKPKTASTSMFGDSSADDFDAASPWSFTPKKSSGGRGSLVKNLLADADVPDFYVDTFDELQSGGSVSADAARGVLRDAAVGEGKEREIWDVVTGRQQVESFGRGEVNVLLALLGLAQEGEELSLDAVDERRRNLPVPKMPAKAQQQQQQARPATPQKQPRGASPEQQRGGARKGSFGAGFGESDPWASPALHKGHAHTNGIASAAPQRTTSTFTTGAAEPADSAGTGSYGGNSSGNGDNAASSWGASGSYDAGNGSGYGGAPSSGGGFGGDDNSPVAPRRNQPVRTATSKGVEEVVTVNLLEEKEGMFMFQHRNYEVASVRRNSKVIRRYSDFVWLLDCLHKRYPFRQLPLLPPKRMQINGNHIAADNSFIEKRRRGLARFANALVRHPVLREEQLVVMFLTVPTELAVWRKQATISVQEEFTGKSLPPGLEDSLPQNLQDTFDTVRSGVRRSADLYISLCNLTERLTKRKEAIATEYGRFGMNLNSLTEASADAYAIDANDVPLLNEGMKSTSKHLGQSQALLEDEAKAWDEGLLEDLKTMRDSLVTMRDMFDRRDRLARDNIPQLEKRIVANEQKLQGIKAKGEAAKPGEAEKVENAITNDKQSIVSQHARGVFIRECVRDELLYFQHTQYHVSRLHQDWAQERVKYAELQADCWRGLVDAVESMPQGD
ncbi:Sorting nexin mvp1 [Saxophila tyrrhenica]|uniref:Sorting nexin MVP1 n=1 Tax=Saxophila tyrrhenica TaxID=1690608 RepID=A0AAV9P5B6_9PEZI|nr:Sorting nexin mvp1 [Saxophila tyrrhenica]